MVLFRVKCFKQCRSRVTTEVRSHFINFVQKEHRVHAATSLHTVNNTTGHCTNVGTAMATDFRFVTNTTQGNTDILTVDSFRNTASQGSFTHARRSYQTKDGAFGILGKSTHCQIFKNAFLNLFQTVVVFFQYVFSTFQIEVILIKLAPRQSQQCVQIIADNCTFCHHRRHFVKSIQFFFAFNDNFFRQGKLCHFLFIFFNLRFQFIAFTKFFVDGFDLFAQIIFFLITLNLFTHFLSNIFFKACDFQFLAKHFIELVHTFLYVCQFQKLLLFFQGNCKIACNHIGNTTGVRLTFQCLQNFAIYFFSYQHPLFKSFNEHTAQRFYFNLVTKYGFQNAAVTGKVNFFSCRIGNGSVFHAFQTFYQNTDSTVRQFQKLLNFCQGAKFI